ncbi:hypothetical protein NUW58_g3917 [Xylaria curta]|uniref:Uncharacterized protein n=1 Tax=Xylaria curta TaxID=42375 RepID=A0ACC1PA62_9PEZI|nr:hypothetical protein NUW58_g3917 [Xylaria curta]
MAHNPESTVDVASLPQSSPSDILGDTKIRRSLVKVSSSQKELLNRHESWASFLSRRSNGFVNLPPQVLEQVKASYTRQKRATELDKATESISEPGSTDVPDPSGSQSSTQSRVERDDEDGGDNANEDPDELTSWASSPEVNPRAQRVESEEPRQPFITQLPEQATIVTSPVEHSTLFESQQSSLGPEDELEVEVPTALAYNIDPINKSALQILATPPSAQVVPCTFEQSMQSAPTNISTKLDPHPKGRSRKYIYNRVPELYRGPERIFPSHLNTNVGSTKAAETAPSPHIDAESSLPINDMTSSIIPSTTNDQNTEGEKHATVRDIGPGQIPSYNPNLDPKSHQSLSASRQSAPLNIPSSLSHSIHSPQPHAPITHPTTPLAAPLKSWEAPFVHYTVTYPGYSGTIQDFVTACIYIQLQYRRIRTSLYDDFIRAWVEGYLPYVKDCDEENPPKKALTAIAWYNEIDDDPLFTSRVVTRQNLQSILNFYPKELEMARVSLRIHSSQGASEHSVSSGHAERYSHISSQFPTHTPQPRGREPARELVEAAGVEAGGFRLSPNSKPKLPHFATSQHIAAPKSFGAVQTRPLTRSLSESTAHRKRVAANELGSEGTKRISLGLMSGTHSKLWSDSGIAASNHSDQSRNAAQSSVAPDSTRQKSTKTTDDAVERRRRRLTQHIKRRVAGRESIASSAPISNTPTSGQKQ